MARAKKLSASASDTEQNAPQQDSARRTAQEAQEEVNHLYEILRERVQVQAQKIYIKLPVANGKIKLCPLYPPRQKEDDVKDWVLSHYRTVYPCAQKPQIQLYNEARTRIKLETELPDVPAQDDGAEPEREQGNRRGRRASQYTAIIQSVEALKDFSTLAREVGVQYARVPYSLENPGFTGVWRLDPDKPQRLLDCAIYFTDINRPHSASKSMDYSGTLVATNAQGERKEIQFSRDELEEKGLDAKLVGFADWPTMPNEKYRLIEALKHLMREKSVALHDQYISLGWAEHPELGLVWIANNGIETAQGFVPSEKAPFIAPSLLSPGNGYRALAEQPAQAELLEDVWVLLLNDLNPSNWARMYGKLGAAMRVLYPEGTVERAGKLDFVIETVGEGSGQGKSAEDCYVLSLFGADFEYNRPPLISTDNTAPSRPKLMEAMRYCPFMTEDRKAREGNPQFFKQHETRKKLIEQYADNTGGGLKMTAYGQKMVSRGDPQGIPFLTGNVDHSAYGLRSDGGEEEATEWRACTFILASDEKADYDVGRYKLSPRRYELTMWGTCIRRWIAGQYNAGKAACMLRIQALRVQAEERVSAICSDWPHTRPMNVCIDIVWGMLTYQSFLQDMLPEMYQESFLWNWIETMTDPFIENRLERARYLQSIVESRQDATNLGDFVLDALRVALGTSQYYIASQQEKLLQPDDVPLSLTRLGMKLDQDLNGNEIWRPGVHGILGYYLARKDAIAFNFTIMYPMLEAMAQRQKYTLPSKAQFKRMFAETGVPTVKRDEYGEIAETDIFEKVNGKSGRYLTIPLRTLYPVDETAQDEEEELLQEVDNAKITPIRKAEPAQASVRVEMNGTAQRNTGVAVADPPAQAKIGFFDEGVEELEEGF